MIAIVQVVRRERCLQGVDGAVINTSINQEQVWDQLEVGRGSEEGEKWVKAKWSGQGTCWLGLYRETGCSRRMRPVGPFYSGVFPW